MRATTSEARDIIIVDNGSVERETLDYLRGLEDAGTAKVVASPGVFNFSRLCNEGAAASNAEVLVFLNNDTEALAPGWLELLIARALEPDIGAAGADLGLADGGQVLVHAALVRGSHLLFQLANFREVGVENAAPAA